MRTLFRVYFVFQSILFLMFFSVNASSASNTPTLRTSSKALRCQNFFIKHDIIQSLSSQDRDEINILAQNYVRVFHSTTATDTSDIKIKIQQEIDQFQSRLKEKGIQNSAVAFREFFIELVRHTHFNQGNYFSNLAKEQMRKQRVQQWQKAVMAARIAEPDKYSLKHLESFKSQKDPSAYQEVLTSTLKHYIQDLHGSADLVYIYFLISEGANVNSYSHSRTPFIYACLKHDFTLAQALLEFGAHVDAQDNQTALMYAAETKNTDALKFLIEVGADLNRSYENASSALIFAIKQEYSEGVRLLLESGANPNVRQIYSEMPALQLAIEERQVEIVRLLVEFKASLVYPSSVWRRERPLPLALHLKEFEIAEILIKAGANPNEIVMHTSLLVDALKEKNKEAMKILVEAGASLNWMSKGHPSALMWAIQQNSVEDVEFLIQRGVNINIKDLSAQKVPLVAALKMKDLTIAKMLIKAGANPNMFLNGHTLLHEAVIDRNLEVLALLMDSGALTNWMRKDRSSALMVAVKSNYVQGVELLLQKGANPNNLDLATETTPLIEALSHPDLKIARMLIKAGAKPNVLVDGVPPLHAAVAAENNEAIALLLDAGAFINWGSKENASALMLAITHKYFEQVEFLVQRGADINAIDFYMAKTPLEKAISFGDSRIAKLLIEQGALIDHLGRNQQTPLMMTATYENKEVMDLLISKGAKLDLKDSYGATALEKAVYHKFLEGIESLLGAKADVSISKPALRTVIDMIRYNSDVEFRSKAKAIFEKYGISIPE